MTFSLTSKCPFLESLFNWSLFNFYSLSLSLFFISSFPDRLRLKKLKDEMRNDELGSQSEDTFNEVLRDFSRVQIMSESTLKANNSSSSSSSTTPHR